MAGTAGIQNSILIVADITGDATAGDDFVITRSLRVVDAHVIANAANASGTITVSKAGAAITSAIVCAVDTTLSRTSLINDANSTLVAGDLLRFVANGAADRGTVVVTCQPPLGGIQTWA